MGEATKRPHCDLCGHDHWRHEAHKWARSSAGAERPVPDREGGGSSPSAPANLQKMQTPSAKPKRQRREYMKNYMTGYRDRKRDELRTYQRDYMRRRRQGGEHGK